MTPYILISSNRVVLLTARVVSTLATGPALGMLRIWQDGDVNDILPTRQHRSTTHLAAEVVLRFVPQTMSWPVLSAPRIPPAAETRTTHWGTHCGTFSCKMTRWTFAATACPIPPSPRWTWGYRQPVPTYCRDSRGYLWSEWTCLQHTGTWYIKHTRSKYHANLAQYQFRENFRSHSLVFFSLFRIFFTSYYNKLRVYVWANIG